MSRERPLSPLRISPWCSRSDNRTSQRGAPRPHKRARNVDPGVAPCWFCLEAVESRLVSLVLLAQATVANRLDPQSGLSLKQLL